LFTAKASNGIVNSPIWGIVILLFIIIGGICNSRAFEKENKVFEQWCQDTVWFNRVFMFYGWDIYSSTERAKDLRIYQQNILADKVLADMLRKDKKGDKHIFRMSSYQAIASLITGIINAACYVFVVLKAYWKAFGVGSILQYVGVLGLLNDGIREFMFTLSDNKVCCLHLRSLFDFLDIPNKHLQGKRTVEISNTKEYCIEFLNVSFKYPETESYALKNFSLTINNKQSLAIVGMNGSGKTTMIKLLCRLYDPTEGKITLNGVNIHEYDYEEYLRMFSVVLQDFKLFAFSLGQNVAASDDVDESRAINSLKRVGFMERLVSMPKGLETPLYKDFEEAGVEISGGEAQKIALARALYRDSPIIILDEPTAALDPIAELEIYSMFHQLIKNKTAIYISHRLSSCKFCDKVAVFHEGELLQYGSHDNLLKDKDGKYSELWEAQLQYYKS
ncbi:MAG: ABC transporter ATP-binding protein/permease, partial [Clostridiales bacterium]|nr:ABC transporter ATP-binding protein/permease [Clostridiales bacterium]